ncbi:BON domain-containing protein [Nitrogeniibacter mangrovi]|uniref:BON domain-containing protein n=1 Tax=Nitrogeniibacter mangrovi TaxID=2016596 RepID=A0A6C1B6T5_9RHOO|nr:BON domain-containing protein [Nitrogeniibacter mangrovi]QID18438.1 BON domain-containing protein [Nitrogeniibacter mangrovi]
MDTARTSRFRRRFGLALCLALSLALSLGIAPARAAGKCEVRPDDISFFADNAKGVQLGAKLQFNKALLREKIRVKVSGGVAILSGNVSSQEAIRTAEKIARETSGIRCVQSWLKVGPPLPDENNPYDR